MERRIGTYGEKSLHREVKWQIEPTGAFHEAPVGKYIADIKDESGVTEIQTQSFNTLRGKLAALLPEHVVTVVYPLPREKYIEMLDAESGEILRTRRSPKRGNFFHAFRELYRIKPLLTDANLRLRLMLYDVTERRAIAKSRKGYRKIETNIREFCGELHIRSAGDYRKLVPDGLNEQFTSSDFAAAAGISKRDSGVALNVLRRVGAVGLCGKSGRFNLYELNNRL